MYIPDENMQFLVDAIGNAYELWSKTFDPDYEYRDSYGFLTKRVQDYIGNKYAIYSVSASTGCIVTKKDSQTVTVSEGYLVSSSNVLVKMNESDVSIVRYYDYDYDTSSQYGVLIGVYHSDIESSTDIHTDLLNSTITASVSTDITLRSADAFSGISFPAIISIDGEDILVKSFNTSTKKAVIDDTYNSGTGTAVSSHTSGVSVYIHKKLSPTAIFGIPVPPEFQTGETSANFRYYPPIPTNFLLLSKVLVEKPITKSNLSNPTAIVGSVYDSREIGDISLDQPFTTEEQMVLNDLLYKMSQMSDALNFNDVLKNMCYSLKSIILQDETNSRSGTFEAFYNTAPVKRASYFKYGAQWDNFERFEFPDGFVRLWYSVFGNELLRTFAIFSGDLMDSITTSGVAAPTNLTGSHTEVVSPAIGSLTPGSWVYYVTAVTTSGESPLSSSETVTIPSFQAYSTVTLTWDAVPGALYYHVYRRSSNSSMANDRRLTSDGVQVSTTYTDTGSVSGDTTTKRGCMLTGKTAISGSGTPLYAKIPSIEDTGSIFPFLRLDQSVTGIASVGSGQTNNGIQITLQIQKSDESIVTETVSIPSGTAAGYSIQIGTATDYIEILDMSVSLIENDAIIVGSRVDWSLQDVVLIQNIT